MQSVGKFRVYLRSLLAPPRSRPGRGCVSAEQKQWSGHAGEIGVRGGGRGGREKKKRKKKETNIFILRGEKMCGDFLKGQAVPAEGAGRGRAGSRGAGPGGGEAALPGKCPSRAGRGAAGGPGPGLNLQQQPRREAGGRRSRRKKTKGAAGAGAAAAPGRGERRRGGLEPRGGAGAGAAARGVRARPPARLRVRARPRVWGWGDAWGSLRLFSGLREACLGANSLCLGFGSQLGPGPLSPGRRKEQPPSPRCICPGSRRGGGEGARGQRAGGGGSPARPGRRSPPARPPAFVRGERGKRFQGRLAELLAGRGGMAVS